MTIKIGGTEVKVPKFISDCFPKRQKEFDKFLRAVLAAQADRVRRKQFCEQKADNMFFDMFGLGRGGMGYEQNKD